VAVYFTDRGIEELDERRGEDQVTLGWLAAPSAGFRRPASRVRRPGRPAGHLAGPRGRRGRRVLRAV